MATYRELDALLKSISLENLKDHAKALHRAAKAGESEARQRVEPYFEDPLTLKLQQAQLVIAREYGFTSWRKLKLFVDVRDAQSKAARQFASLINEYNAANQTDVPPRKVVNDDPGSALWCSVCEKSQYEVRNLIVGPRGEVCICNECVGLCVKIIAEADATAAPS